MYGDRGGQMHVEGRHDGKTAILYSLQARGGGTEGVQLACVSFALILPSARFYREPRRLPCVCMEDPLPPPTRALEEEALKSFRQATAVGGQPGKLGTYKKAAAVGGEGCQI